MTRNCSLSACFIPETLEAIQVHTSKHQLAWILALWCAVQKPPYTRGAVMTDIFLSHNSCSVSPWLRSSDFFGKTHAAWAFSCRNECIGPQIGYISTPPNSRYAQVHLRAAKRSSYHNIQLHHLQLTCQAEATWAHGDLWACVCCSIMVVRDPIHLSVIPSALNIHSSGWLSVLARLCRVSSWSWNEATLMGFFAHHCSMPN